MRWRERLLVIALGVYTGPDGNVHRFLFLFISLVHFSDGDNPVY